MSPTRFKDGHNNTIACGASKLVSINELQREINWKTAARSTRKTPTHTFFIK